MKDTSGGSKLIDYWLNGTLSNNIKINEIKKVNNKTISKASMNKKFEKSLKDKSK